MKVSIFGESHGAAIGVVVDGLPAGEAVDLDALARFMARRAPGQGAHTTSRREADAVRVLAGLTDGVTNGAPFAAVIENTNTRGADYRNLLDAPRPGHADYTAYVKYGGHNDVSGGGHFPAVSPRRAVHRGQRGAANPCAARRPCRRAHCGNSRRLRRAAGLRVA